MVSSMIEKINTSELFNPKAHPPSRDSVRRLMFEVHTIPCHTWTHGWDGGVPVFTPQYFRKARPPISGGFWCWCLVRSNDKFMYGVSQSVRYNNNSNQFYHFAAAAAVVVQGSKDARRIKNTFSTNTEHAPPRPPLPPRHERISMRYIHIRITHTTHRLFEET